MKNLRENILKYGIFLILVIIPIFYLGGLPFPYLSAKTFIFYGIVELMLVFWVYNLFVDRSYYLNKKQLTFFIFPLLYLTWMTLSGILASNPHLAFWSSLGRGTGLITYYHLFFFSLIIVSVINKYGKKYLIDILKYFIVGSFLFSLTVWLGDVSFNIPINAFINSRGGGFVGNSSLAASYLIFGFFFSLYLIVSGKLNKTWKIFIYLTLFLITFSPLFLNILGLLNHESILGQARGALIGIIIGIGSVAFFYLFLSKKKIIKIFGIIGIIISITTFLFFWFNFIKPGTFLHEKFIEVATGTRFLFWDISQKSINEHPLMGYGPENYPIAFQRNFDTSFLRKNYNFEVWVDRAHNIYFDTGVSGGYPAIVFYLLFLLSILYGLYKVNKYGKLSNIEASVLGGLVVGYVFQNLFVFDHILSLMSFYVLCALVCSSFEKDNDNKNFNVKKLDITQKSVLFGFLFIVFITLFINLCYLPIKKSYKIIKISTSTSNPDPDKYMGLLKGSSVGNDYDISYYAQEIFNDYYNNIENKTNINYIKDNIPVYLKYLEELSNSNKTDFRLYMTMLRFYDMEIKIVEKKLDQNSFDYIMKLADHAKTLNDKNPQLYWLIASINFSQGNLQEAVNAFQDAIKLDPQNKITWSLMANMAKAIGSNDLYNTVIKEAQNNIPDYKYVNK